MCRGRRREKYVVQMTVWTSSEKKDAHKKTQTAFAFPPKWRRQSRKRNSLHTLLFFIFFLLRPRSPLFLQIGSKRRRRQKKSGSDLLHFPPAAKRIARKEKEKKDTGSPFFASNCGIRYLLLIDGLEESSGLYLILYLWFNHL